MKRLLVFLLLTGCITNNYSTPQVESTETDLPLFYEDSTLIPYVTAFKKAAQANGYLVSRIPITMIFGKASFKGHENAVGWCSVSNGRLYIKIDNKSFWAYDAYNREELVFHEIAHCLIDRDHCDYKDPNTKRRVSLMSSTMGHGNDYKEHRDEYIKELFHINPNCPK